LSSLDRRSISCRRRRSAERPCDSNIPTRPPSRYPNALHTTKDRTGRSHDRLKPGEREWVLGSALRTQTDSISQTATRRGQKPGQCSTPDADLVMKSRHDIADRARWCFSSSGPECDACGCVGPITGCYVACVTTEEIEKEGYLADRLSLGRIYHSVNSWNFTAPDAGRPGRRLFRCLVAGWRV
jgi:hypothetical protein